MTVFPVLQEEHTCYRCDSQNLSYQKNNIHSHELTRFVKIIDEFTNWVHPVQYFSSL